MNVNDLLQETTDAFIEADRLMETFPEGQREALRALVSGLVGLTQVIAQSHRRIEAGAGDPLLPDLAARAPHSLPIGME